MERILIMAILALTAILFPRGVSWAENKKHPAFAKASDDPELPDVLLIGDSISMGYTIPVRELLNGKTNVHRPSVNCGPTIRGLDHLDEWLEDRKWAVIHFNFGLHDLRYMNAEGTHADNAKQQVPVDQYEKNLETLVNRLKKTGARLIWASTTPVPEGAGGRMKGDAAKYNAAAKKVMDRHGISINDLYAFALPRLEEIQRPANVHFTTEGSEALASEVARVILENLAGTGSKDE